MLPDGAAGGAAAAEILPARAADALVIDGSTIEVDHARALAAGAAAHGIAALEAPVRGGTAGAEAASLTFIAGARPRRSSAPALAAAAVAGLPARRAPARRISTAVSSWPAADAGATSRRSALARRGLPRTRGDRLIGAHASCDDPPQGPTCRARLQR